MGMTFHTTVIASLIRRGNLLRDCFVVSLLAMTGCGDCFVVSRLAMTSRPDVIPDLIGYPENKKSSCADIVRWILGASPRMTGKSGVIANAVWQSLNRLLRHFIPRNDGVFKNVLAMTSHPVVIPDLIGYPGNKKSSCADVVRWILGSSPRMTGKSGVIANEVEQSLNRLLRHFIPRNDGVFKNVLAMTGKFQFNFNHII